jgi:hypothetical protein
MGMKLSIMKILAIPENLDRTLLVEAMLGKQFMFLHRLHTGETLLVSNAGEPKLALESALPGMELDDVSYEPKISGEVLCMVAIESKEKRGTIDNAYRLLQGLNASICVSFVPAGREEVVRAKVKAEEMLSRQETGITKSASTRGEAYSETASKHMDIYYGSDEKGFLEDTLEMLNSAMLVNGNAYKVSVCVCGEYKPVYDYLRSRMLILEEKKLRLRTLEELCRAMERMEALPFDNARAARMLGFSNSVRINKTLVTTAAGSDGEIVLGHQLDGSIKESSKPLQIGASSLNLGTLISGVPGTGKTLAAMHLVDQLAKRKNPQIAIISPTDEWNGFGHANRLEVVRLYGSRLHFNFFKCDSEISIERFYENLAMLMASASDAGPYTGSLEKCLLAAFRKLYSRDRNPDPVEAYAEIEEAVIEQHGKRSNIGVKYTKHGENVRAALENLRSMLNRPEFAKREGVDFRSLLKCGAVFDLSGVSNKMKPLFYALILNQAYSLIEELDTMGDSSLRMLLCIEEAQIAFPSECYSAATLDLTQRIQDFRKKGVGALLITHNVTDIEPGIRRLCQTKLYFRQSADVAKYAANDLLFDEKQKDMLVERLKGLGQRVCALNYMQERRGEKFQAGSVFIKVPHYTSTESSDEGIPIEESVYSPKGEMKVKVTDQQGVAREGARLQLFYVGEKKYEGATDVSGEALIEDTIRGNQYKLVLLGEKKKDSRVFSVIGGELNIIKT